FPDAGRCGSLEAGPSDSPRASVGTSKQDTGTRSHTRPLRAGDAAHDEQRAHVGVGQLGAAVDRARIALRYWTFAARDHPQYGGAPTRDPATLVLNREGNERIEKQAQKDAPMRTQAAATN